MVQVLPLHVQGTLHKTIGELHSENPPLLILLIFPCGFFKKGNILGIPIVLRYQFVPKCIAFTFCLVKLLGLGNVIITKTQSKTLC